MRVININQMFQRSLNYRKLLYILLYIALIYTLIDWILIKVWPTFLTRLSASPNGLVIEKIYSKTCSGCQVYINFQ